MPFFDLLAEAAIDIDKIRKNKGLPDGTRNSTDICGR